MALESFRARSDYLFIYWFMVIAYYLFIGYLLVAIYWIYLDQILFFLPSNQQIPSEIPLHTSPRSRDRRHVVAVRRSGWWDCPGIYIYIQYHIVYIYNIMSYIYICIYLYIYIWGWPEVRRSSWAVVSHRPGGCFVCFVCLVCFVCFVVLTGIQTGRVAPNMFQHSTGDTSDGFLSTRSKLGFC